MFRFAGGVVRACTLALLSGLALVDAGIAQPLEMRTVSELTPRSIGPAVMSGRVADIDVHPGDSSSVGSALGVIYIGTATGGVWKSVDGGLTFQPITDGLPTSSIGAVAVSPADPDVVWVGTGEGNPRNSMGTGLGLYRSDDGGASWQFMGFRESDRIHRILIHPRNPDIVYVGIMGNAWRDHEERGVFRTMDGGRTWSKVLYVDAATGVSDMVMDPANPDRIFVGMWSFRRTPWDFTSGGPGSGLFVTADGGASWRRLTEEDGLPHGPWGRIGVAVAPSDTRVVYALIEADETALLRSDDGGETFRIVNERRDCGVGNRPFYYNDIRVDSNDPDRVYNLYSRMCVSADGGRNFRQVDTRLHVDHHELWIHPRDGRVMIVGNDGGAGISHDRGQTWRFFENLPLGQYYHVSVDMESPFNIYGGLQDNGSWRGPSAVWEEGGILAHHWRRVGGGDGFGTLSDPDDAAYGYAMMQAGNLRRFNFRTGEAKDIRPVHPDPSAELRFNWNAAIATDPFDPATVFYGSQFLHRSPDRGDSWEVISPDLTTNEASKQNQENSGGITRDVTGAENHTTIVSIAPSPLSRGVIWVGTDDGNVQITRDGGGTWSNRAEEIPDVPAGAWVSHIEAGKHDPATAYVVFDDHRRGNLESYMFRTTDWGETWTRLPASRVEGFVHVIEEDPAEPNLLWAGTEFGLFASLDAGETWSKWTAGFPTVPVFALITHPRDHDLVIGTHGRSLWVLDDVRPLRELAHNSRLLVSRLHLFEMPDAWQVQLAAAWGASNPGYTHFRGENRLPGALITFIANGAGARDSVIVEVQDQAGDSVRRFRESVRDGLNRIVWDLRMDGFHRGGSFNRTAEASPFAPAGAEVLPGLYTVRLVVGNDTASGTLRVRDDPRVTATIADRQERIRALVRAGRQQEAGARALQLASELETALDRASARLSGSLRGDASELREQALRHHRTLSAVQEIGRVARSIEAAWERPTRTMMLRLERAEAEFRPALEEFNRFLADAIAPFRLSAATDLADVSFPDLAPVEIPVPGGVR